MGTSSCGSCIEAHIQSNKCAYSYNGALSYFQVSNANSTFDFAHYSYGIELQHELSTNVVCVTSKGSDQPVHTRSLINDLLIA